jgi:hypothetical protein
MRQLEAFFKLKVVNLDKMMAMITHLESTGSSMIPKKSSTGALNSNL